MGIRQQDRGGKFGRAGVLKNLALRKSSMAMCFLTHKAFHGMKVIDARNFSLAPDAIHIIVL